MQRYKWITKESKRTVPALVLFAGMPVLNQSICPVFRLPLNVQTYYEQILRYGACSCPSNPVMERVMFVKELCGCFCGM